MTNIREIVQVVAIVFSALLVAGTFFVLVAVGFLAFLRRHAGGGDSQDE